MSLDGMKTEYHLTPRGWIAGAQAIFGPIKDAVLKRPDDALITFEEQIHQESEMDPESTTWIEIWRREGVSDVWLAKLYDQYGSKARA
jgi:hypothetical protein